MADKQKRDPYARRAQVNKKRANAWAQIANAYKVAKDAGKLKDLTGRSKPVQIIHSKGDTDGALFKVSNDTYESEIKQPLSEAWEDIDARKYTEKVKKAIKAFEDLKGPGGKGRGSTYYDVNKEI